jgi:hypothetical protein
MPNRSFDSMMRPLASLALALALAACAEPPADEALAAAEAGKAGISDEQDFDAVAARETIESDRERLAAQREQYVFIPPTALPDSTGVDRPIVIDFALQTSHQPGQRLWERGDLRLQSYARACGRYAAADLAQEAFLKSGGPERDVWGIDPDGDGFACGWDPRPFRLALR